MIVLRLSSGHPDALLPHRHRPAWTSCVTTTATWLRLPPECAGFATSIPASGIFSENADGSLTPLTRSLPSETAPGGPWIPLTELIPVSPALSSLPATTASTLPFLAERTGPTPHASALLAAAPDLLRWAASTSRFRMQPLTFAASPRMALVRGFPLPPINGTAFHFDGSLAIPSGFQLADHLHPSWIARCLSLPANAVALIFPPDQAEIIGPEAFVPCSLSALRRSFPGITA